MKKIFFLIIFLVPAFFMRLAADESELEAARKRVVKHREEQSSIRGDVAIRHLA